MLSTFKETVLSLKDHEYGKKIIAKPVKAVILYWTKYILFFAAIPLIILIPVWTYFSPQLPKLFRENIPEVNLNIKNGIASSSGYQPVIIGDSDFSLVMNLRGRESDLDNVASGILLLSDKLVIKSPDKNIQTHTLQSLEGLDINSASVINWISAHLGLTWLLGTAFIISFTVLAVSLYWSKQFTLFLLFSGPLWLVGKVIRHPIHYINALKIIIYASVLPLIISAITIISPNTIIDILNIGLFAYFTISWYRSAIK